MFFRLDAAQDFVRWLTVVRKLSGQRAEEIDRSGKMEIRFGLLSEICKHRSPFSGKCLRNIHGTWPLCAITTCPLVNDAAPVNTKVAAPLAGEAGINPANLRTTASVPDCLVSAGSESQTDNKPQPESVWPACDNSLCAYWKHGKVNCTLDKCKW
jgi:hypothetical protein